MIVYHVTPRRNLARIYERGLDPATAHDKWGRVWFCSEERIDWAIKKVAARHNIRSIDQLAIIALDVRPGMLRRNRAPGIYQSDALFYVTPDHVRPARSYLLR